MTQAQQILNQIKIQPGVTNWQLAQIALKYSSRISELRKSGHNIRAERLRVNGRATGTYKYYLIKPTPSEIQETVYHADYVAPKAVSWLDE